MAGRQDRDRPGPRPARRFGVAWLGKDYKLVSIERTVRAGAGAQRVFALVSCEETHHLTLRNVALDGNKTVFTLRQFKVTANLR